MANVNLAKRDTFTSQRKYYSTSTLDSSIIGFLERVLATLKYLQYKYCTLPALVLVLFAETTCIYFVVVLRCTRYTLVEVDSTLE
jgi:hypothetical protein